MSWEVYGHAQSPRSKWAPVFAGVLFIGALGLGQWMVSSRAGRLLGPEAETAGWAIRFSKPAFMQSDRTESAMLFIDAALGIHSPTMRVIRLKESPIDDIEPFCVALWKELFGPPVPDGRVAAITIADNPAWEVVGPDGAAVMKILATQDGETYVFAYTAGIGSSPERSRAQFDAVCDSVRLRSPG